LFGGKNLLLDAGDHMEKGTNAYPTFPLYQLQLQRLPKACHKHNMREIGE